MGCKNVFDTKWMINRSRLSLRSGFTLGELMISVGILAFVLTGMLQLFIYCSVLTEKAANRTMALNEVQSKLEEMRETNFSSIATNYGPGGTPGNTFNLTQVNGKAVIYIDSSNVDLLLVKIAPSWQTRNNRVVGEDQNLNFILDLGEDSNNSGDLDSEETIVTMIERR